MEIQGYFTGKGLALSAKLIAGATLTITRVLAGGGQTADPMSASVLPQVKQTLSVNPAVQSGNTAIIPATLAAVQATTDYTLTELGIYAKDPDEGEILYKIYRLDAPVAVVSGSAMVLRFYFNETVSQTSHVDVTCSPAGLIAEREFGPVREVVQSVCPAARQVTMEASDLPAFLNALPRLLTERLTITIKGTLTLTEPLNIDGFYGSGVLVIQAANLGDATIIGRVWVTHCRIHVTFSQIQFQEPSGGIGYYSPIFLNMCSIIYLNNCSIMGQYASDGDNAGIALATSEGGITYCYICKLTNARVAMRAAHAGIIACQGEETTDFSGNCIGAEVAYGSIILLSGNTPDNVGGVSNQKSGGIIANAMGNVI